MGTGDGILFGILLVLAASFPIRFRGRYTDDQRDDASLYRKRSDDGSGDSGRGDGRTDRWT